MAEDNDAGTLEVSPAKGADIGPLVRLAVQAGADIEEVGRESSSLEDAFLAVIDAPGSAAP